MRVLLQGLHQGRVFSAAFLVTLVFGCSFVFGEEPKSPFERVTKTVESKAPVQVTPSKLDKMEFTGLLGIGGEVTISLYDAETKQSHWIPLDGAEDGISVSGFDEDNGTISVSLEGITREIAINENEIVTLKRTAPVRANGSGAAPPKKAVAVKDDETLIKEEEARLFVSDLLANGMKQREEFRKAREARTAKSRAN